MNTDNSSGVKELDPRERKCYYDETGMEIQEGDLLKVFHFISYRHRKKEFMYQIVVLEEYNGFHWWSAKDYYVPGEKGHYRLFAVASKETGIIRGTRIIASKEYENQYVLRSEAKRRMKLLQNKKSNQPW